MKPGSRRASDPVRRRAVAQESQPSPTPAPRRRPWRRSAPPDCPRKGPGRSTSTSVSARSASRTRLYTNVRPDPSGDLSDNWAESYAKPRRSPASFGLGRSELYGKVSAVGERTHARAPAPWSERRPRRSRSKTSPWAGARASPLGTSENLLDFTVGRTPYTIGHGLLLLGRGGEGGSRGGFWSNARKAWEFAAVGRLKPGKHTLRGLLPRSRRGPGERHRDPAVGRELRLHAVRDTSTFGASYLKFYCGPAARARPRRPERVQRRGRSPAPSGALPGLSFELEYAQEEQRRPARPDAFTGLAGYETMSKVAWSPKLSYRYAVLQGRRPRDAPRTKASIHSCPASSTGAPGGRARSPESTSCPTPT